MQPLDDYTIVDRAREQITVLGPERIHSALKYSDAVHETDRFTTYDDGAITVVVQHHDNGEVIEGTHRGEPYSFDSDNISITHHASEKMKERGFYENEIRHAIDNGHVVEVEESPTDNDDLLKVLYEIEGNIATIVIDPEHDTDDDHRVVTVFTRSGENGRLKIDGQRVDRATRRYTERKQ